MDRWPFNGSEICEEKSDADISESTVRYVSDTCILSRLNVAEIFSESKEVIKIMIIYYLSMICFSCQVNLLCFLPKLETSTVLQLPTAKHSETSRWKKYCFLKIGVRLQQCKNAALGCNFFFLISSYRPFKRELALRFEEVGM